eukprot:SAG31_NODE_16944_length_689_cov_1.403390_1_plen_99_part_01
METGAKLEGWGYFWLVFIAVTVMTIVIATAPRPWGLGGALETLQKAKAASSGQTTVIFAAGVGAAATLRQPLAPHPTQAAGNADDSFEPAKPVVPAGDM